MTHFNKGPAYGLSAEVRSKVSVAVLLSVCFRDGNKPLAVALCPSESSLFSHWLHKLSEAFSFCNLLQHRRFDWFLGFVCCIQQMKLWGSCLKVCLPINKHSMNICLHHFFSFIDGKHSLLLSSLFGPQESLKKCSYRVKTLDDVLILPFYLKTTPVYCLCRLASGIWIDSIWIDMLHCNAFACCQSLTTNHMYFTYQCFPFWKHWYVKYFSYFHGLSLISP